MKFTASLDATAITKTMAAFILMNLPVLHLLQFQYENDKHTLLYLAFSICLFLALFLMKPNSYQVSAESIDINRHLNKISVRMDSIQSIEELSRDLLKNTARGGAFGFFGKFYIKGMGETQWYGTRKNKIVLITSKKGKKIIVTPDNPSAFVKLASGWVQG